MNKCLLTFITFLIFSSPSLSEVKLTKLLDQLNSPWSLTVVEDQTYLITEKSGNLVLFNKTRNIKKNIKHNLSILEDGQGGLLDVLYHKGYIYLSY